MKKTIFISLPSLWAIRNFIYSGIIDQLKTDYSVVILIPEGSEYLKVVQSTGCEYREYPVCSHSNWERMFLRSLNIKLLQRSEALRKSKLVSLSMYTSKSIKGKILSSLSKLFSVLFSEELLFKIYGKALKDNRYNSIVQEISKFKDAIILATNIVVKHELILFMHLSNAPGTKIDFVNSFDNTTSRGYVPFKIFDYHLVWNKKMKEELNDIFKIIETKIQILGTPQFDLLTEGGKTSLLKSDKLFEIVENKQYILYCAGHYSLFPFEVDIVYNMVMEMNKRINDLVFIVRLHPLDNHDRWNVEVKFPENVIFDIPWKQNTDNPLLSIPEKYEYIRHGRILKNSQLILNLGSTTSLDACVLDKAVFNICFKNNNTDGELDLIYKSEHYTPIIASEAAPLIHTIDELEEHIRLIYDNNEAKLQSDRRQKFASEYCGFSKSTFFSERFMKYLKGITES